MASGTRMASLNGSSPSSSNCSGAPLGAGYCGPTVADKRVFVMDRQTEPQQLERVLCFDADGDATLAILLSLQLRHQLHGGAAGFGHGRR